jgi:hypothetical protein
MVTEGIEALLPKLAIGRQPGVEVGERAGVDLVHAPLRLRPDAHQAGLAQHAQMLRGPRLAEAQGRDELVDGAWLCTQQLDSRPAVWV